MENTKTCGDCALYHKAQGTCLRTKAPTSASDFCSRFTNSVPTCEICGQMFIPPAIYVIEGEKTFVACGQCSSALSTCRTCKQQNICDFQTNPINLPHQVQQQTRQGNMIMSQTVMNPARIAETCEKGCHCWDPIDKVCNKQAVGLCGNGYKPSYLP